MMFYGGILLGAIGGAAMAVGLVEMKVSGGFAIALVGAALFGISVAILWLAHDMSASV